MIFSNELKSTARILRREFDAVMTDPHSPDRFRWDWWHLPGRYTHLRTPAEHFFSDAAFDRLTKGLRQFGREKLGCTEISPIWLSSYIEGCEQRLHADRPHGPWAFVLSLTPKNRVFAGGETMILKPETLNFWNQSVRGGQAFEESAILNRIPSEHGRLFVFDPRIPHGVSRVSGTVDPALGRLVVHGWFTQPNPFVDGPLRPRSAEESLQALDQVLATELQNGMAATGTIAFRILIPASGLRAKTNVLASSLYGPDVKVLQREKAHLTKLVREHFNSWRFPKAASSRTLTLPLSFER